ncbi:type IV toxin-antitoxin system AbiEi family antitoxin [Microbacterium sp. 3J1]|uniref:type IV toxin-antitoxin system AbiEi family antitoxin n=1 Tax=Microbacterium sp. 3J1 TaxID=861269 RepID=UPI000B18D390|nr:type IV toxin-antitoxin system AbiEi family antitoxin [Microbacterium sp. 3J1]
MHPAFLYLPGARLELPELRAALLDGHLVAVGEAFIPADLVEGPGTRASSIATLIPQDTAASGPTAAWIHGAGDAPPALHHVRRVVDRRIRPVLDRRVTLHDVYVPESELVRLGGVAVLTPRRTMVDLALGLHRDESLMRWIAALTDVSPTLADEAIQSLDDLGRVPGKLAGRAALARIAVRTR